MMLIAAERLPMAVGVNVTLIVQVPFAATELPHVLVSPKSPGLAPVNPMLVMDRAAFPVLFRVTTWAGVLVVPTVWLLKSKLVAVRPTVGPRPVPVRLTDCWLPATLLLLSVMVRMAARLPEAAGVNVTLIVQLLFAASELPHVVVSPKSPGLVPVNAMLLMVRATFPVLLSVTVWAALGVPTLLVNGLVVVTPAMGALSVPVRFTDCVLPATLLLLSVMVKKAARVPIAVGVNVTLIVQLLFAANELPHVVVSAKSRGLLPVTAMLLMVRVAFPVLFRVKVWAGLVEPRFWLLKVRLVGVTPAMGALPVPVRATASGLLCRLSTMLTVAVRIPTVVGANFTTIVQLAFGASELPQLFVSEKSPGLRPTILMPPMVKLAVPVFNMATLCAVLVVPTF